MKLARREFLHLVTGAAAAGSYPGSALALDYPTRPITIVVPFAAGGATDVLARLIADSMGKSLGQTVIVEDVTGAAGSIGVGPRRAIAGGRLYAERRYTDDARVNRRSL
jgi:tripartite-type tricarboxylate transporter receptor subunit TctC